MSRRHRYAGSISVNTYVDVDVNISELDDQDLLACIEEAEERGISTGQGFTRHYAELAYDALLRRRYGEAVALLDRCLRPTLPTRADYEKSLPLPPIKALS